MYLKTKTQSSNLLTFTIGPSYLVSEWLVKSDLYVTCCPSMGPKKGKGFFELSVYCTHWKARKSSNCLGAGLWTKARLGNTDQIVPPGGTR